MDDQRRELVFIRKALVVMLGLGPLVFAIGAITLLNLIVSTIVSAAVFAFATRRLRRLS